ncbi:MAG: hypothetical protein KC910_01005 [Candidatus Eremiobacteraeota bacterium]|nr:hypothetical protein [Candidatus Eremiobacteraeota bacterium]
MVGLRRAGYSFVEIVVAFALLSLMVGIFFNLLPASRLASHRAENRLQASNIAQNLLEDRRSRPFDELVVGKTESFTEVHGRITYQVSLKISTVSGVDSKYVKQARVEVDWKEKGGPQKLVYELRLFQQNR